MEQIRLLDPTTEVYQIAVVILFPLLCLAVCTGLVSLSFSSIRIYKDADMIYKVWFRGLLISFLLDYEWCQIQANEVTCTCSRDSLKSEERV